MIKNTTKNILNRTENDFIRAVLLSLFSLVLATIFTLILVSILYYYFAYIDGSKIDDILNTEDSYFSPNSPFHFQMIIMAILVAPIWETFMFFKLPLTIASHYKFNKTLSVHIVSFVFSFMHVFFSLASFGKLATYFFAVVSSWSWYLYQELPEDKKMLYPYWFLVLIHALYNMLSILIIILIYKFIE